MEPRQEEESFMTKIDFKKKLKHLYGPSKKTFEVVDVPEMAFLMMDGQGDPNVEPAYEEIVGTLYSVAYTVKFASKAIGQDYVVPPLEGLWWAEDMDVFSMDDKGAWQWTMMVMQPDWITAEMVEEARREVAEKKETPRLPELRLEAYREGLSVQIMHVGPYDAEGPTIERMHAFIADSGYEPAGKHHEIYLSDPRRTKPENLKTVLRQPIRKSR
jgi:hypothetical protein